jgi:hypothetical protein
MKQEQKEKWSLIHQHGQKRFIFFYGILLFGLPFTLMISIMEYYSQYGLTGSQMGKYLGHAWFWIIFRCLFFGTTMGFLWWRRNETAFKE